VRHPASQELGEIGDRPAQAAESSQPGAQVSAQIKRMDGFARKSRNEFDKEIV